MKTKLLFLLFSVLAFFTAAAESTTNTLTDKSPPAAIMTKYEKVLAAARKDPPAPGGIICIGSSHMELWKTVAEDPRAVILYEGSNDIAAGSKPADVLANFQKLHRKLHAALPETRLYVLGIVPSPGKRFERIADMRATDELLRKECETQAWMKFIDTTTPLIGADGQPKAECFIPGNIHMLPAGYAVWKSVIAPVVVPAEKPFEKDK